MAKYKQLTSDDRLSIENGLRNKDSFKKIGETLGKDCTTISKEIRSHLIFRKSGAYGRPFNDCLNRKSCQLSGACSICPPEKSRFHYCSTCGRCTTSCVLYQKETCTRLLKAPYVCNGCSQQRFCTLEKRFYEASQAQAEHVNVLSESRQGFALSDEERKRLDDIVSPLLFKGQSLHHICLNHRAELMVSERTLYSYMDANLFSARNIDMPRRVRMHPRRKRPDTIKVDPKCREGRTMKDFNEFLNLHPDTRSFSLILLLVPAQVQYCSPLLLFLLVCSLLFAGNITIPNLSQTFLTDFILNQVPMYLQNFFLCFLQIMAASFRIRQALSLMQMGTAAVIYSTAMLLHRIKKEAAKCIMR